MEICITVTAQLIIKVGLYIDCELCRFFQYCVSNRSTSIMSRTSAPTKMQVNEEAKL